MTGHLSDQRGQCPVDGGFLSSEVGLYKGQGRIQVQGQAT